MVKLSNQELLDREVAQENAVVGTLDKKIYDCPICLNRGHISFIEDGEIKVKICNCLSIRRCIQNIIKLGIDPKFTFENFTTDDTWQKIVYIVAKTYADNPDGWFFLGGQSGCGKTHICSAIVRQLLSSGKEALYVMWEDTAAKLKSCINDYEEYERIIKPLREVEILYIDDFLKPLEKGKAPTAADFRQAYAILNSRYNRPELKTIITSEYWLNEILDLNGAIGGRIVEKVGRNKVNIARLPSRNYRLKVKEYKDGTKGLER